VKTSVSSLAVVGGMPAFPDRLNAGQNNLPGWERFERSLRDIFARRYYTNHGPLVQELESRLAGFFGVKNVICMTNGTIGLMIAARALGLRGRVIVPAFTSVATIQSLTWAGLEPVFCDVDPLTHRITTALVEPLIDDTVSAILGVHLWGNACDPREFEKLAEKKVVRLYFDAAHAFGSVHDGIPIGRFGDAEVFSLNSDNILNAAEGCCICTDDDALAESLRNIRSSYGIRTPVSVPITGNGRMSEAQAALALLSLEDFPGNRMLNAERFDSYRTQLAAVPGIRFIEPQQGDQSNYQHVVVEIDSKGFGLARDALKRVLEAENISCAHFAPGGWHRRKPYADLFPQYMNALENTDIISSRIMLLPSGQQVSSKTVSSLCSLIGFIHEHAAAICVELERVA